MTWRKSTLSHTNGCVEVARRPGYMVVRDSKDPDGPTVAFTPGQWRQEVLAPICRGEFDDRDWMLFDPLRFDTAERSAFVAGVLDGEFDLPKEVTQ